MTLADVRVQVHPGDGIVANFGTAVIVCLPAVAAHDAVTDALLTCVEAGSVAGPTPGRTIARSLAELLSATPHPDVPPFAVVSPAEDGLAIMLAGAIDLELE